MKILSNSIAKYYFEKEVIKNPALYFKSLSKKIHESALTPMPEFEGIVQELLNELFHPFIQDLIKFDCNNYKKGSILSGGIYLQYQQTLLSLRHVSLTVKISDIEIKKGYPHRPLTKGRYPYQPTLEAISTAMNFFDSIARITHENNIDLYHSDRYTHYEMSIKHCNESVIIPSSKPLTLKELISLRAAPVFITGVNTRTTFADAYFNSPKDFWVHDANHNRRFRSYNEKYFREHNITKENEKFEVYQKFQDIIQEVILPSIEIKNTMNNDEKNKIKMKKALYFELLHEFAFTPDRESIIYAFRFRAGDPAPFEIMQTTEEDKYIDEERRLKSNNLNSGIINFIGNKAQNSTTVIYFHDRIGPNFITSLFNKLTHSFYDNQFTTINDIPEKKARTPEMLAEAALEILADFNISFQEANLPESYREAKIFLILLAENKSLTEHKLGDIEKYPHKQLKKPKLKRDVVESIILPQRKEEIANNYESKNCPKGSTDDLIRQKNSPQ